MDFYMYFIFFSFSLCFLDALLHIYADFGSF